MDAWPAVQVNQADQQAHSFLMSRNEDYFDPRASLSRPCKKTILSYRLHGGRIRTPVVKVGVQRSFCR
jgi:hypothetical protein